MSPGSCSYSEMSVCTLFPRGHTDIPPYEQSKGHRDIRTSHCTNGFQGTYGHLTVQMAFWGHRGHTDISLYKRFPGDIGDIRTSHCTNGFQGTYRHLTVQMDSRGHRGHLDISLYDRLPGDIRISHCTNRFQGT